ncbi:hypothetical protein [Lactococcus lactis]|jgi:hypothetical protein|uniref:Uncharacterized protein n=3 Tax=Streptococcaceae TaxID=1300 RepID=A0ABD5GUL6_9LACT|nr:hypothetical protein [Lactococcus lactis]MCT0509792.1 hypothetical protein [Lactococcus cremoris]MCT1184096.1 hypothetical protein [Lactococcus lactis]MDN6096119.1 hypothetical protein [Lactococcus lactis]MDV2620085.1 hypothetical protein [Lactococcus lactis]
MKKLKIGTLMSLVTALVLLTGVSASADEFTNVGSLYDKAVSENIIDPNLYPKTNWEKDERSTMRPSYEQYKKYDSSINYESWLKTNNYGVMSDTKLPILQTKEEAPSTNSMLRSSQDNINAFCRETRAGDILIVGGNFPTGVIGHAAILNADGYVLEMPGGPNWFWGISDNNRQLPKRQWITNHIKEWTSVYRIRNTGLARQVARYADTHFYNTYGGATKNIHINYLVRSNLKVTNPNYCSKLVWQAYYFGSGNLPVMYGISDSVVAPTGLPALFTPAYAPYQVGRY